MSNPFASMLKPWVNMLNYNKQDSNFQISKMFLNCCTNNVQSRIVLKFSNFIIVFTEKDASTVCFNRHFFS